MNKISEIKEVLDGWRINLKRLEDTLQVGRCGSDDMSFDHGGMDMLDDCIDELSNTVDDIEAGR
jgi:hypothetical protein